MIGSLGASSESLVDEKGSLRGASQEPRARLLHAALDDANLQCENPQATSKLSHNTSITAKTERICTQQNYECRPRPQTEKYVRTARQAASG